MMIIDGFGQCGAASASKHVSIITDADGNMTQATQELWNGLPPLNIWEDSINWQQPAHAVEIQKRGYSRHENTLSMDSSGDHEHNFDIWADDQLQALQDISCCRSQDSAGYISTIDFLGPDGLCSSNAICASLDQIKKVLDAECQTNGVCHLETIDYHRTLDRGYVGPKCEGNYHGQHDDTHPYDMYTLQDHDHDDHVDHPVHPVVERPETTSNIGSWAWSWKQMLRFAGFEVTSGGTFKVCFCEASQTSAGCQTKGDYNIEVGTLHSSGVSCLIENPLFQRHTCVGQLWGVNSNRCYKNKDAPDFLEAPVPIDVGGFIFGNAIEDFLTRACDNMACTTQDLALLEA
jgi:hypothetical protein